MTSPEECLGVIGAGSMGAGIAELAIQHGFAVVMVDASATALAAGGERIEAGLARSLERGHLTAEAADDARRRLTCAEDLESLAGCGFVIEAIAERLETKRAVFSRLCEICPSPAVLATNTSSLRVSSIAAGLPGRGRIVGLHFFNPATRMQLVEVIGGLDTDASAVARAVAVGERLGKRALKARDGIGFLVNRSARPYIGEALRLVQEGVADFKQIDRICRMGGGFRMGPFELADLIGVDVNLEITESFWFQSYGEPRWRPSPIQAQLVAAGRIGRKVGAGFHTYPGGRPDWEPDPEALPVGGGQGRGVSVTGDSTAAAFLREAAVQAGFDIQPSEGRRAADPWLVVEAGLVPTESASASDGLPRAILCAGTSLRGSGWDGACGFHLIAPERESSLVELTTSPATDVIAAEHTRRFFNALGFNLEEVGDAPGLVLGRIVAQLVNEAAFCLEEDIASASDIDAGARLGLNYPRGPIEWSQAASLDHIRAVLRSLARWRGEERYRLSPLLTVGDSLIE